MTARLISTLLRCIKHTICAPQPQKKIIIIKKKILPSDISAAPTLLRCGCGSQNVESNLPDLRVVFPHLSFSGSGSAPSTAAAARREHERHSDTSLLLLACDWPSLLPVFLLAARFDYLQIEQRPNGPRDHTTLSNPSSLARIAKDILWSRVTSCLFFIC